MFRKKVWAFLALSLILVLSACGDSSSSSSSADEKKKDDYPNKDIDLIVTWASGGGTDITARQFVKAAEEEMPAKFLVKNVTGGAGAVGWNEAKQAKPDGYTLTVLTADILIHTANDRNVSRDDFVPLALMSQYPAVIAVDANSEWDTLEDFLAEGEKRSLSIANDGLGQNDHLTALQLEQAADLKHAINHIPFDGGAEGIAAVLGGNVDATISNVPEISSRTDMKVLAIFSTEPNEEMPDTPLISDYNMDIDAGSFRMIAAPAGTDEDILNYLEEKFKEAYNNPTYQDFAKESNLSPSYMDRKEAEEMLDSRLDIMKELMEQVQ